MRKLYTLIVLLILAFWPITVFGQKQYNLWYFGYGKGLDFSSDPPTVISGELSTFEGSAVYCDSKSGELRLYTDGMIVWNREHKIMPNGQGLIGDPSSTQAALILPDPANIFRYYIFHSDHSGYGTGTAEGVHYSICDMQLAGGLGDIVQKNIPLLKGAGAFPGTTEKLTAIPACDRNAYWILSHEMFNNTFVVWYLDANGLSDPIRTNIGVIHGMTTSAGAGYLVASPDGTMLASAISSIGSVEIYKFDQSSGKISDVVRLPQTNYVYGVCFSPSGKKLYVSGGNVVSQYDITSWDSTSIAQTRFDWNHFSNFGQAIMQGPDGKLYLLHWPNIGVIAKPDEAGEACEYDPLAISLSGLGSCYGLPNNISMLDGEICRKPQARIAPFATDICEERCLNFYDSSRYGAKNYLWTFEGATPSTSTDRHPKNICFSTEGVYSIKLVVWNEYGKDSTSATIRIKPCPVPEIALHDTIICLSECLMFRDTSSVSTKTEWTFTEGSPSTYTGKTPPLICYYRYGRFQVRAIASNQYGADTAIAYVTVEDCSMPIASFTHDTVICAGSTLALTDKSRNAVTSWEWTFEGGTPGSSTEKNPKDIVYTQVGLYEIRLIVSSKNGSDTMYSRVRVTECLPPVAVLHDYEICEDDCIYLEDSSANDPTSWEWQLEGIVPGVNTTAKPGKICYETPGRFSIQLISRNSYGADTIRRNVLVRPATGYARALLDFTEPLEVCTSVDTSFWVYAGCKDNVFELLSSNDPNILLNTATVTIPANDSLRVPVHVAGSIPGSFSANISFSLNGEGINILCNYTVGADKEKFLLSDSDAEFATPHCESITRELTVTNNACSEHEISRIYLDPVSGVSPFTLNYDGSALKIEPEGSLVVAITYDPTQPGDINTDLVIETAEGNTHRCSLRGVRAPLPKLSLELRSVTHNVTAGDKVGVELAFETTVGDTALPTAISVTLDYNTDLLSIDEVESVNGWILTNQNEIAGKLHLLFDRSVGVAISAGDQLAQITFKTYLAMEDSTPVALSSVICNSGNEQSAACVLAADYSGNGSVHVGALCGDEILRETLGKHSQLNIIVQPNPINTGVGKLSLIANAVNLDEPLSIELVELSGKTYKLSPVLLTTNRENITLDLPPLSAGSYLLRATLSGEQITRQIVIY